MDDAARVRIVKLAVAAALAAEFLIGRRLWLGPREFPAAPAFGIDMNGLQPWLFQGAFLLTFLFLVRRRDQALSACRLVIAGMYLWSGLQKINGAYMDETFPWLTDGLALPAYAAAASAIIEAGIGLALLHPKTRNPAVVAAVTMHLGIFISLISLGWNVIVWPWNLMMIAAVVALFWRVDGGGLAALLPHRLARPELAAWIFFVALPFLSVWGLWDSYLSSSLYTNAITQASLRVPASHAALLPPHARDVATPDGAGVRVEILTWSLRDLDVPVYPEPRVYREVGRRACAGLGNPSGMTLDIRHRFTALRPARIESIDCATLARNETGP